MKLTPPSFLVLGMLRLGARSGYAIKKTADLSTRNFWPMSLAQVYPELARLEQAGLVTRRDDSHGERARSAYKMTERGEQTLLAWLRSPKIAPAQVRDEALVRLFFADALPPGDQLELVRRLRACDGTVANQIRTEIIPLADQANQHDLRFPAIVARLSADLHAYAAEWLGQLEQDLQAQIEASPQVPDPTRQP